MTTPAARVNPLKLSTDDRVKYFRAAAQRVVDLAEMCGVVVTVTRQSRQPPRMGAHDSVVDAYPSHHHRTGRMKGE